MMQESRDSSIPVSVRVLAEIFHVSRSGYYRWLKRRDEPRPDEDERFRKEIEQIVTEMAGYGYRRVTAELHRRGFIINSKRVRRIMKEGGLIIKRKRFHPQTTDSSHENTVYPNLIDGLNVTRPNQVWVADITYIQLEREYVYLAAIMDRYSRRIIGWSLSRGLDVTLPMDALLMAFHTRHGEDLTDLIHHSDQGKQYASSAYTEYLKDHGVRISMSRKANPYDNAHMESAWKTLKIEEVYLNEYENFQDAYDNIEHFIEEVYNKKRLHSSLGYKTPLEFELEAKIYIAA